MCKPVIPKVNAHMRNTPAVYFKENQVAFLQFVPSNRANHAEYIPRTALNVHIEHFAVKFFGKARAIDTIFRAAAEMIRCTDPIIYEMKKFHIRGSRKGDTHNL